jgi:hypothetical protein
MDKHQPRISIAMPGLSRHPLMLARLVLRPFPHLPRYQTAEGSGNTTLEARPARGSLLILCIESLAGYPIPVCRPSSIGTQPVNIHIHRGEIPRQTNSQGLKLI